MGIVIHDIEEIKTPEDVDKELKEEVRYRDKKVICKKCNQKKKREAKGYCPSCYYKIYRGKNPDKIKEYENKPKTIANIKKWFKENKRIRI